MSLPAFRVFLVHIDMSGRLLLPEPTAAERSSEAFISARDEWTGSGLCELDFDGKLHFCEGDFARMVYLLRSARSAVKFTENDREVILLKGLVDVVRISADEREARISCISCPEAFSLLAGRLKGRGGRVRACCISGASETTAETDGSETPEKSVEVMRIFMFSAQDNEVTDNA